MVTKTITVEGWGRWVRNQTTPSSGILVYLNLDPTPEFYKFPECLRQLHEEDSGRSLI